MEGILAERISKLIKEMQDGLLPETLANWYAIIRSRAKELCPGDLRERISFEQDGMLPMKFKLNLSKRAIPFVISAIEQSLPEMPYSTRLYFEKVQEIIMEEYARSNAGAR